MPGSRFVVHVDSNGHVDREAAARAGIAVYGKNTLAITRHHGSWVVLGVLISDVELEPTNATPDQPAWDACGECRACIDACPTDAIVAGGVLDARRCLSYLSQSRLDELPPPRRSATASMAATSARTSARGTAAPSGGRPACEPDAADAAFPRLARLAGGRPRRSWRERYRRLYIPDSDGRHLQRNARVALANQDD